MRPNFDVQYQIKPNPCKIFMAIFISDLGLAYSPLNSATLSCSSDVTLLSIVCNIEAKVLFKVAVKSALKRDFKVQNYFKQVQQILDQTKIFWTWVKEQNSVVKKKKLWTVSKNI